MKGPQNTAGLTLSVVEVDSRSISSNSDVDSWLGSQLNSEPSMGALGYLKDEFRIHHYTPTMLMEQSHCAMLT